MNTRKFLAAFLSAAMVLTSMAVPVFADDAVASAGSAGGGAGGTTVTNPTTPEATGGNESTEKVNIAQIGDKYYSSLKAAVDAVSDSATIKLLSDTTESITIAVGNDITLDLNGYTLTNDKDAHTITNNGSIKINDSSKNKTGKVENKYFTVAKDTTTNESYNNYTKAVLFNAGGATAELNGGTFERTEEHTYYTIKNLGTMVINDGVTVKQLNEKSSAVANGCQNNSEYTGSEVKLTINGGTFVQGLITIKNDECGVLEINGGSFKNIKGNYTVFNWNKAVINKGTFEANYVVGNGKYNKNAIGDLDINGGTFNGIICPDQASPGYTPYPSEDISISGGTFSEDVSKYCVDKHFASKNSFGKYVIKNKETVQMGEKTYSTIKEALDDVQENAATIKLLNNTTESITIAAGKDITLDLNGYTLTNDEDESIDEDNKLIKVGKHTIVNYGTLTITDNSTAKTGKVDNVSNGRIPLVNYEGGKVTLNGGTFDRSLENGIVGATNKGANSCYTIKNWGNMTINEGTVVNNKSNSVKGSSAIGNGYQDGSKFDGHNKVPADDVNVKLIINGGKFTGGLNTIKNDDYAELEINGGTFENSTQQCVMNWNIAKISCGSFTAKSPATCAIYNGYGDDTMDKGTLTITGGNFDGKILVADLTETEKATTSIIGGTFSEDVSKYCVDEHFASKNSDGKYEVKNIVDIDAPVTSLYKKDKKTTSYAAGTNYTLINDYSDNDKIVLFYTLDGSDPTTSTKRKVYNGEKLKINKAVTVKTVYMKACGECENCTAEKYSECTDPVYGQIGTYKYTVKKKNSNSNSNSSTGTSTRGVTYGGRTYTSDIFGVEHKSHDAYINGYADGTVKPDGKITREEIAAILYRVSNDASAIVASGNKFNDVSADRWSAGAIEFMAGIGVINGYADGSFKPSNNLTRAEFAALVSRFANLSNNGVNKIYNDIDASNWAYKYVMELSNAGYMNGYEDGSFRPESEITRAEVVTVINKIIGRNPSAEYVKTLSSGFSDLSSDAWYYTNVMEATTTHEYYLTNGIETKWENIK